MGSGRKSRPGTRPWATGFAASSATTSVTASFTSDPYGKSQEIAARRAVNTEQFQAQALHWVKSSYSGGA